MSSSTKFSADMLRKFTPKYTFNIFNREDIDELNRLTLYISGLIIKDEQTADEAETARSMKAADRFIRATEGTLRGARSFEVNAIIKNYSEENEYYKGLRDLYNIPPYKARKARDREIITSLNSSALSLSDQSLYQKCYYDTLAYYKNVTYTRAFSNQDYNVEFFNWYLTFSAALKFLNSKMEGYFDVDTYDKLKLKNGFISWGLDYFDDFPLVYQRKIYKAINDLVRSKGTNEVFIKIQNIFKFSGLGIHKYHLGKNSDNTNLVFYRTPIDAEPNFTTAKPFSYENLTNDDPYWRADKEDILDEDFSPVATKYISVDTSIDVMDNSKKLSYLVTYLNEIMIYNENLIEGPMLRDKGLTREEAIRKYGILDDSFNFRNARISSGKIRLYDGLIALMVLLYKRMNWPDTIHRKLQIPRVYQYTSQNLSQTVEDARSNLYWSKKRYRKSTWKAMMDFLNEFKIKTFSNYNQVDLKDVLDEYARSIVYSRQIRFIAEHTKDDVLPLRLSEERNFEALEYLMNSLLDPVNDITFNHIYQYTDLQELLTKFVEYELNTGSLTEDKIYASLVGNDNLLKDVEDIILAVNTPNLKHNLATFKSKKNTATAKALLTSLETTLEAAISAGAYKGRMVIHNYKYLAPYLNIFIGAIKPSERTIFSVREFLDSYYYNEELRTRLEGFILQAEDPEIYNSFLKLWNDSYVSTYRSDLMRGFNSFSEYLLHADPELYTYVQVTPSADYNYQPDYSKEYRDKIIELTESISTYLDLKEELFIQNSFVGITSYIKDYMNILITIFKSYTTQTVATDQNFSFTGEFDNYIRVTDSFQMKLSTLSFMDVIEVTEAHSKNIRDDQPAKGETLKVTEGLTLTITDGAATPVVKKFT